MRPTSEESLVDARGPVFHREWPGEGPVAFVCVHGLGETLDDWAGVAPGLAVHGRVLALDLPGFGRSPRRGRRTMVDVSAEVVSAFMDATVDRPVVLVGSSYGGAVAVALAAREPERVAGCVLTGSYLPPQLGGSAAPVVGAGLVVRQAFAVAADATDVVLDPWVRRRVLRTFGPTLERERRPFTGLLEGVVSLIALSVPTGRPWELFEAVRCPVLLVHGGRDRHVPVDWARAVERELGWDLAVLDRPHQVQIEDPDRWLDVVRPWLEDRGLLRPSPGSAVWKRT